MSSHACQSPLSFERFLEYWFGDLASDEAERIEEQLFLCPACGRQSETWAVETLAAGQGMGQLSRGHLTSAQVAALGERASVVPLASAEVHVDLAAAAVQVFQVTLDDEARSELDRLDVEYVKDGSAEPIFHASNVPLDRETGSVYLACSSHLLRAQGDSTLRLIGTRGGRKVTLVESLVVMH